MNNRHYYLDAVGGLLLIHMIIGHCCQWSQTFELYQKWTYCLDFFMPWFFFKAGMFFKQRPFKVELHKNYRRLILPYIFFSIIGIFLFWLKLGIIKEFSAKSLISPFKFILFEGAPQGNLALWFLLSLFVVKNIFSYLHLIVSSNAKKIRPCVILY